MILPRIGHGSDVHRLTEGRPLILGGVTIPFDRGLLGHSDADVLLHALMDALLGAGALGDIGKLFPDSDPRYKGADSRELLRQVARVVREAGYQVGNVDVTLVAQRPKVSPYIPDMRENIARDLGVDLDQVSVKATTEERLGFTGSGEGMAAHAVALIYLNMYFCGDRSTGAVPTFVRTGFLTAHRMVRRRRHACLTTCC